MRVLFASLALAAVALPNFAAAQSFDPSLSAAINHADLNLASPAGIAALEGRVKVAANRICDDFTISPIEEVVAVANCRESMMSSARRQLHLIALSSPQRVMLASR